MSENSSDQPMHRRVEAARKAIDSRNMALSSLERAQRALATAQSDLATAQSDLERWERHCWEVLPEGFGIQYLGQPLNTRRPYWELYKD